MKIYKNVPDQFHSRFMDAVDLIEKKEEKHRRYGTKQMILLVAVLILALSTITVGAAYIFAWNQAALDKLGVSEELAEQMNQEGIAKQEHAAISAEGVNITAIQSVMTDDYCYVLLSISVPEQIVMDGVLFRETYAESDVEFEGCVVSPVTNPASGYGKSSESLWEAILMTDDALDYSGADVVIVLHDLYRSDLQAEFDETLVEGEWRIPLTLPSESEVLEINQERTIRLSHHEVNIKRTEVTPFKVRLYGDDEEELKHAIHYQKKNVPGIIYQDGTFVEEDSIINVTYGHNDGKTGEYYIDINLSVAIDITQYADIVLEDNSDMSVPMAWSEDELNRMTVLQDRAGHKILFDGVKIILWDEKCGVGTDIMDLAELGYDENSGELTFLEPGSINKFGYDENDGNLIEVGSGGRMIHAFINGVQYHYEVLY